VGKNYGQDIKSDDWDDETLWQVGVNLKYNLLDFGKRDAGVQKAKIAKLQANLNKEQLLLDVKKSLIEGVGKVKQAYAQYVGNEAQYVLSRQSEKIEQVRYDNDATTLNDLLLAKSKTQFAKAKVIESKYTYQKSVYYIDYLMEKGAK
jgi:outer membrane protein TolC